MARCVAGCSGLVYPLQVAQNVVGIPGRCVDGVGDADQPAQTVGAGLSVVSQFVLAVHPIGVRYLIRGRATLLGKSDATVAPVALRRSVRLGLLYLSAQCIVLICCKSIGRIACSPVWIRDAMHSAQIVVYRVFVDRSCTRSLRLRDLSVNHTSKRIGKARRLIGCAGTIDSFFVYEGGSGAASSCKRVVVVGVCFPSLIGEVNPVQASHVVVTVLCYLTILICMLCQQTSIVVVDRIFYVRNLLAVGVCWRVGDLRQIQPG